MKTPFDKGLHERMKGNYSTARHRRLGTELALQGGSMLLSFLGNQYASSQRKDQVAKLAPQAKELGIDIPEGVDVDPGQLLQGMFRARADQQQFNERAILADLHEKALDERANKNQEALMTRMEQMQNRYDQREQIRADLEIAKLKEKQRLGIGAGKTQLDPASFGQEQVNFTIRQLEESGQQFDSMEQADAVARDLLAKGGTEARTMFPKARLQEANRKAGFWDRLGAAFATAQANKPVNISGDIDAQKAAGQASSLIGAMDQARPSGAQGGYVSVLKRSQQAAAPAQETPTQGPQFQGAPRVPYTPTDVEWGGAASAPASQPAMMGPPAPAQPFQIPSTWSPDQVKVFQSMTPEQQAQVIQRLTGGGR